MVAWKMLDASSRPGSGADRGRRCNLAPSARLAPVPSRDDPSYYTLDTNPTLVREAEALAPPSFSLTPSRFDAENGPREIASCTCKTAGSLVRGKRPDDQDTRSRGGRGHGAVSVCAVARPRACPRCACPYATACGSPHSPRTTEAAASGGLFRSRTRQARPPDTMADRDPIQPIHEPTLARRRRGVRVGARRRRPVRARRRPRAARPGRSRRSTRAWRSAPPAASTGWRSSTWRGGSTRSIRVFTLDTGRLPPGDLHAVRGGPRSLRHRRRVRGARRAAPSPRSRPQHGPNAMYRQRRPPHALLHDPQGRAAEAQALDARRLDRRSPTRAVGQPPQHREGRARPRPRRHRQAESARRLDARPRLGLRPRERGPLPRAVRPRLHVDRLRAVHARRPARRVRARRPLVVGGRHRTRSAASTARCSCWAPSPTARRPSQEANAHDVRPHARTDPGPRGGRDRHGRGRATSTRGRRSSSARVRSPSAGCA